jgi:hypothetical protein
MAGMNHLEQFFEIEILHAPVEDQRLECSVFELYQRVGAARRFLCTA